MLALFSNISKIFCIWAVNVPLVWREFTGRVHGDNIGLSGRAAYTVGVSS